MATEFEYIRNYKTKDGVFFQLRPATPDDCDIIENNIKSVCAERIFLSSDSLVLTHEWRKVLENSVDEIGGDLLIVVQAGKAVVGHLRIFSEWYGQRGRHVGIIGLSIIPAWREKGIGTALLALAIEWSNYAQFKKLTASVIVTNQRAVKLFDKFSFSVEGLCKKQFYIDGNFYDELLLARFLE